MNAIKYALAIAAVVKGFPAGSSDFGISLQLVVATAPPSSTQVLPSGQPVPAQSSPQQQSPSPQVVYSQAPLSSPQQSAAYSSAPAATPPPQQGPAPANPPQQVSTLPQQGSTPSQQASAPLTSASLAQQVSTPPQQGSAPLSSSQSATPTPSSSTSSDAPAAAGPLGPAKDTTLPSEKIVGEASYYDEWASPMVSCNPQKCGPEGWCAALPMKFMKANCGNCVKIVYKDKAVIIKATDSCPGCGDNKLDLSVPLFKYLTGSLTAGRVPIEWAIVPCA